MTAPKISVIVPCYNQAEFMDECLQSVLDQTYQNWECIIVNDGSLDETEKIALKWTATDHRFRSLKKENGGLSSARNAGIKIVQGDWIQFLDCDDFIHSEKFQKSVDLMDEQCKVVLTNFQMFYENSFNPPFCDITNYPITLENLILQWDVDFNIPIHCPIFKKTALNNIQFNERLKAKEDWLFWIDLFKQDDISYQLIDEPLAYYRHNTESLSKNFALIYDNIRFVNRIIYENNEVRIKDLMFEKLNSTVYSLNNTNLSQKNYIRQLQNTKILKYYLALRKKFNL